jgi:hypothetical protein
VKAKGTARIREACAIEGNGREVKKSLDKRFGISGDGIQTSLHEQRRGTNEQGFPVSNDVTLMGE